jgi:hypothetical protein
MREDHTTHQNILPIAMTTLHDAVTGWLHSMNYEYHERANGSDIRFQLYTAPKRWWRAQFLIDERARLLRLFVFTDDFFLPSQHAWASEIAARVSAVVVLGSFEYTWDDQDVCYRSAVRFVGRNATVEEVGALAAMAAFPLKLWNAVQRRAERKPAKPAAVLNAVLLELGAYERKFTRGERRRQLSDLFESTGAEPGAAA